VTVTCENLQIVGVGARRGLIGRWEIAIDG
jgi:hypothetical protein